MARSRRSRTASSTRIPWHKYNECARAAGKLCELPLVHHILICDSQPDALLQVSLMNRDWTFSRCKPKGLH